jgi:WD40 repeat protein
MLGQAMQVVESVTNVRVVHGGDQVYRAAFSPDGTQFAVVASHDADPATGGIESAVVKTYDAQTGVERIRLPQAPVLPLKVEYFDHGRRLLVTGYPDSDQAGAPLTLLAALSPPATIVRLAGINGAAGLPLSPDGTRVLVNAEAGIVVHDAHTGDRLAHWMRDAPISASTFSADGELVAVAERGGPVHVLDAASGKPLRAFAGDPLDFAGIEFSRDGRRLFAFTRRGDVRLWDLDAGRLHLAFAADRDRINEIRLDASGRRFATVGSEGYKVWSALRGSLILFVPTALNQYASADLSSDGDTLVTADYDNSVAQVWDVRSGRRLQSLDLHNGGISAATFDNQGQRVLLASRDGRAEIWRSQVKPAWRYDSFETYPYTARFDREGRRMIAAAGDLAQGSVLVFDVASRALLQRLQGHRGGLYDARFSPSQEHILTASRDGSAGIWEVATGRRLATLSQAPFEVAKAIYAADGRRLLTIANPADIKRPDAAKLWDAGGNPIAELGHAGGVISAAMTSDGAQIVTGGEDGLVKIWDADGRLQHTLQGHRSLITAVALTADDRQIVTAAADRTARIWDRGSGALLQVFDDGALGVPSQVQFSHDASWLAIGTQEGRIFLWWPLQQRTLVMRGHTQRITDLRFSANDALLFSASADGTARVWDARAGAELSIVAWHAAPLNSLDLSKAGLLATASYSRLQLTDVALENRSAQDLGAILACRTVWTMRDIDQSLQSREPTGCDER